VKYTSSTSKVARKTSGELAQRILIREHKRIPKFDVANLEVQEVYRYRLDFFYILTSLV
jgi:RPE5 domain-containing protein